MVLPFGVGIGDVIQVANLTKIVISELKKTGDAAPEYQLLVNDLENLERILTQINQLEPVEHDLAQLEPVRAAIKACQIPLQSFLDKISKFEELLGTWSFRGRSISGIGRRIQWKVAYKSDVKDLRASLASHVNVLTLHIVLQSLKNTLAAKGDRAGNFQTLHREIEAQSTILESLKRGQLADPNQHFNIKNTLDTITEKFDQSMSLNADNQTNLNDHGTILQSIESRSQTIHLDQGEMLRNLHSEIQHIKQYQSSDFTTKAEFGAGKTAHPCRPSSKLTLLLESLGVLVAASTAALTYTSTTQLTTVSHTPVRPSFGSLLQETGDESSNFHLSRTYPEESPEANHSSIPLDQQSAGSQKVMVYRRVSSETICRQRLIMKTERCLIGCSLPSPARTTILNQRASFLYGAL